MGDRVQLQQVMMNLISNSIDAMKDVDGTHELAIKSRRAKNEQLMVSVSDTGVGLPPQQAEPDLRCVFLPRRLTDRMGLSISRSIVASHNGHLWPPTTLRAAQVFTSFYPPESKNNEWTPTGRSPMFVIDDDDAMRASGAATYDACHEGTADADKRKSYEFCHEDGVPPNSLWRRPRRSSRTCRRDKARVGYRNAGPSGWLCRKLGLETFAAKGCGNDAT